MEISGITFLEVKTQAEAFYKATKPICCPFFGSELITLNSDGFNHLEYKPNRLPRNVAVAMHKFRLLPQALKILKKSGTLQEYRKDLIPVGNKGVGGQSMKWVEYFGFSAILGENYRTRVKVIVRRVGDGNLHFWSVMPHANQSKNGDRPRLMKEGREDE